MKLGTLKPLLILALPLALLGACNKQAAQNELPAPRHLSEEAAGYYCQMVVLDHAGPKAQLFLSGMPEPLWFSQVRDGIAYLKSPERDGEPLVLYVNDMGRARSWDDPGADNWIDAADAFYVVGSDARGGMGAPELVPFGSRQGAETFIRDHGGKIMRLDEIPAATVLSPVEINLSAKEAAQ